MPSGWSDNTEIRELASNSDTPQRETYEDHYKAHISGGLNEFWTQAEYSVHFRLEKEQLSLSISDGNYSRKIPPLDRSEGFLGQHRTWFCVSGSDITCRASRRCRSRLPTIREIETAITALCKRLMRPIRTEGWTCLPWKNWCLIAWLRSC